MYLLLTKNGWIFQGVSPTKRKATNLDYFGSLHQGAGDGDGGVDEPSLMTGTPVFFRGRCAQHKHTEDRCGTILFMICI